MYGLDFGDTQRVETRQGTAYVREAAPTEQFWKAWRKNKDAVKAAGFSLRKYQDEWAVSFWSDREDCPLPEECNRSPARLIWAMRADCRI